MLIMRIVDRINRANTWRLQLTIVNMQAVDCNVCFGVLTYKMLGLQRLEERRYSSRLITENTIGPINPELFFFIYMKAIEEDDQKLFKKRFRLNVRKYAFLNRVIDWNLLPASCINCSTINTFNKHLLSELELAAVCKV